MAVEQYANLCYTVLTANYTAGAGSITVGSTGSPWPASPQFHAYIAGADGVVKVILKITAVTDGTHWAVTAEGSDANCVIGDTVKLSLTAGAMDQIRSDISQLGTYSSLPSSGMKKGDRYQCTDAPYSCVYDGSTWRYFLIGPGGFGEVFPPSLLGSWSWDNQGSSVVDATRGYFALKILHQSAVNAVMYYRAKTAPYTVTMLMDYDPRPLTPLTFATMASGPGIAVRDGSGKIVAFDLNNSGGAGWQIQQWTNSTNFSASSGTIADPIYRTQIWLRIADNSTNIISSWSLDGFSWYQFDSRGRNSFTTGTTAAGIFCYANTSDTLINVLSWQET